nr:PhzF family phenazine biosynthesis protein [Rathayibacter caricis]
MDRVTEILRLAAFPATPDGGNPAGVVLDATALDDAAMQGIAADVGYAETAFAIERTGLRRFRMRYFSPVAEVPFCGHATIATAVALAERDGAGAFVFDTPVGEVAIGTRVEGGAVLASFTSVEPRVVPLPDADIDAILRLLGLDRAALDARFAPAEAFAGNRHPILVLEDAAVFDGFSFEPAAMRGLMDARGWSGTVTIARALPDGGFETRNLFPVGTLSEDPATGSAAAALGGWLRAIGAVAPPTRVVVHQGRHVGRPSVLLVDVPASGGITMSGSAHAIEAPPAR